MVDFSYLENNWILENTNSEFIIKYFKNWNWENGFVHLNQVNKTIQHQTTIKPTEAKTAGPLPCHDWLILV